MRRWLSTLFLATVLSGTCMPVCAQDAPYGRSVQHGPISEDLPNALAQVASLSNVPMIAELAQPLPEVQVAAGTGDVGYLLREIARQAPEYDWEAVGKVLHFYNKKLRRAKFNFLNLRFARFSMPANVSELKLTFPTREFGLLLQGYSGGGIATTGFGDVMLEKNLLQPAVLENVTGREILFRAANESPMFSTIIVFPNSDPTAKQMERDMNRNWFWQALTEEHPGHLYVQPPLAAPSDGQRGKEDLRH
jgi:hypothetical protein